MCCMFFYKKQISQLCLKEHEVLKTPKKFRRKYSYDTLCIIIIFELNKAFYSFKMFYA